LQTPTIKSSYALALIMASAAGIPDVVAQEGLGEDEPLLGQAGDASQQEGRPLYVNLIIGQIYREAIEFRLILLQAPQSLPKPALFSSQPPSGPASSSALSCSSPHILSSTPLVFWFSHSRFSSSNLRTPQGRNDKEQLLTRG
jgi:hypothetical protein